MLVGLGFVLDASWASFILNCGVGEAVGTHLGGVCN